MLCSAVVMTVGTLSYRKLFWCDSLYRQNTFTLEIHCQLVVFGDALLRPHNLGRGCREFKSGLASIMITPLSLAEQEHWNTAQVVELVLENHEDTIQDLSNTPE